MTGRRLYAWQGLDGATTCAVATRAQVGLDARPATDADVRAFWQLAQLDKLTTAEACARFKVSRQTLANWRARAGAAPTRRRVDGPELDGVLEQLRAGLTVAAVAGWLGLHESTVRRAARAAGVTPAKVSRKLPDDQLVELARGRTWQELAATTRRAVSTLRARAYRSPALSRRLRDVMRKEGNRAE